jgi:hypothetical protein
VAQRQSVRLRARCGDPPRPQHSSAPVSFNVLLAYAHSRLRPSPGERALWEAIIATIRRQLDEDAYHTAWSIGQTMSLEQILA